VESSSSFLSLARRTRILTNTPLWIPDNIEVRPQDENISFESKYERGEHYDKRMYLLPANVADLIRLYK
jgi:hypothetical protein